MVVGSGYINQSSLENIQNCDDQPAEKHGLNTLRTKRKTSQRRAEKSRKGTVLNLINLIKN